MCGIFAYIGDNQDSPELVIKGLKRLEYRGYDSWGIASLYDDQVFIKKDVGKIGEVNVHTQDLPKSSFTIGHSRWATHGGVTKINAHPHATENQEIIVAHNGIFDNYLEIKHKLVERGHSFISETDTEVFAHLVQDYYDVNGNNLEDATRKALEECEGRYAVLVIAKGKRELIAARRGSPLIIGVNDDEYFVASDIPAFLEYTNKVVYLDDDQMAVFNEKGFHVHNIASNDVIEKRIIEVKWKPEEAGKDGHEHFMIKEIMEQKETLRRAINQNEEEIMRIADEINNAYGTYLVGCGTAGKVCLTGTYLFTTIANKHVNFAFGSEFPYMSNFIKKGSLLIAVSQSGETADTLEAIEAAQAKGAKVLAIVNVESSTMARIADYTLMLNAGPEKAVASTKATTSQMALLMLLAYACAGKLQEGKQLLIEAAGKINDMLNPRYEERIEDLAEKIHDNESMYIIGRGAHYPMALEAAIKLQEVSYIHAEGFAGGELKHGPLALITEGTPVIALVPNDETRKDILSNAMEIRSRGGYIIGVSPENSEIFDKWIKIPEAGLAAPIISIIPIQILAYQLALVKENDPDMPRNLAKSVTVK